MAEQDNLDAVTIHELVNDYKKLEHNSFWRYFWSDIKGKRKDKNGSILEQLGHGQSLPEAKLRFLQGQNEILEWIIRRPQQLFSEIEKRL